MLRFGPADAPAVIAAPALFEEGNRTRAMLVDVLRRLADAGIGGVLPDLPGQGESLIPTQDARLTAWREAFAAAARSCARPMHVVAWRGGALVDAQVEAASRWYLSPVAGAALVRDLRRTAQAAGSADYAGNLIADEMLAELHAAEPSIAEPLRVVRLESDPRAADRKIAGPPPWRASEPVTDAALQEVLAQDIAAWVRTCDR
jgi:hypothetical protein